MRIGAPCESKPGERRVALLPAGAALLAGDGHEVCVEAGAGSGVGVADSEYARAGARIVARDEAWNTSLVVKVKEIQPAEVERIAHGSVLFGFQQLVGAPAMVRAIAAREASAIAFELVGDGDGRYALLAPMSRLSGRLAIIAGAQALLASQGGSGVLLAAVAGVAPARVLVLGAGEAGCSAAALAQAMGASVTVLTRTARSRDAARTKLGTQVAVDLASPAAIEAAAIASDLIVGAVWVPGSPTPRLLSRALVARMRRGSVLVDVCIDGGGISETSRPTTLDRPTYVEEGVIHYCVPNMPAAVPHAAAGALAAASLPFVRQLAGRGIARALCENPGLRSALLLWNGRVCHAGIAAEAGLACMSATETLAPSP